MKTGEVPGRVISNQVVMHHPAHLTRSDDTFVVTSGEAT